jgi:hypothetical protein
MICQPCNIACLEVIEDVPAPHAGKYVCPQCRSFRGWIGAPWTYERAASFVVPIGCHKGQTLSEIEAAGDRHWIEWAEVNLSKGIAKAARVYLAGPT